MNTPWTRFKEPGQSALNGISIVAIMLGVLLRILYLGRREYWYDEILSVIFCAGLRGDYQAPEAVPIKLARYTDLLSIPDPTQGVGIGENLVSVLQGVTRNQHAPLFYIFHNVWMRLFGNSEIATRSLVMLMSLGAIAAAYGLGRKLLGHRSGLLLGALLAVNPFYLAQSLHFRMHGALPFWAGLSGLAMLSLTLYHRRNNDEISQRSLFHELGWSAVLIVSVTAGLLTNYLFSYWFLSLAILALYLDRNRWFFHGIRLGIAGLLTVPWILWGVRQQLRNARFVLDQFGADEGEPVAWMHLQDIGKTLGSQLVWGESITHLPSLLLFGTGVVVLMGLGGAVVHLWKQGDRRNLIVVLLMSLFPLSVAIIVDILTEKFTVGWGGGRAILFILPGLLFLQTLWIDRAAGKWKTVAATSLLGLYLLISIGDYTLRDRQPFNQLADSILTEPNTPTLIALNSRAWGHVLRLAYYIPPTANVDLLARDPADLALDLEQAIAPETSPYTRIIWLNAARSVWSPPATPEQNQQVETLVTEQFCTVENTCLPTETKTLSGTMELDEFTLKVYQRAD